MTAQFIFSSKKQEITHLNLGLGQLLTVTKLSEIKKKKNNYQNIFTLFYFADFPSSCFLSCFKLRVLFSPVMPCPNYFHLCLLSCPSLCVIGGLHKYLGLCVPPFFASEHLGFGLVLGFGPCLIYELCNLLLPIKWLNSTCSACSVCIWVHSPFLAQSVIFFSPSA